MSDNRPPAMPENIVPGFSSLSDLPASVLANDAKDQAKKRVFYTPYTIKTGDRETKVRTENDRQNRHELFLLGDGEKKVEVEIITEVANAAIFHFNKEDHTLANMLRDKLFRLEHVTFSAYKVPHPLFATFDLRVHTDGEISPKEAVLKACQELVQELQQLSQEFTKEVELRKLTGQGPSAGLDL